jgi:adenine-specific DNA-methyltransferase
MGLVGADRQMLPRSGPEREALREKGQFWTPDWVADAMVAYVIGDGCDSVFDPAVGAGAFLHAVKRISNERGLRIELLGYENDPEALRQAEKSGLSLRDLSKVEIRDFVGQPPERRFKGIVANPPYIRHHRIPPHLKAELRAFGARLIGKPLDGRAGLHIYFLLRALQSLEKGGRLAFIMPADTCEGVFAPRLWKWITANYRLDGVIAFSPEASPFPDVDTNALIFLVENRPPREKMHWVKCKERGTKQLRALIDSRFSSAHTGGAVQVCERSLDEALHTGLSREPSKEGRLNRLTLGGFASVMRGIATGANNFFFLTRAQAEELRIPKEFLIPAIGRTRDAPGNVITAETLNALDSAGRPTLLFSVDGRPANRLPEAVRNYIRRGEALGLGGRPLIKTRQPWYKMETRAVPPILFAYLGRRNGRFILNLAGVTPLTCFLCVYPQDGSPDSARKLWSVLQSEETLSRLASVGKSYGGSAIKVEPRALERLPLPETLILSSGLKPSPKTTQLSFH